MRWRSLPKLVCHLGVAALIGATAIAASACDTDPTVAATLRPTRIGSDAVGVVSVITPAALPASPASLCLTTGALTFGFDLIVTAHASVSVDRVTLHLLDGSNIGGSPLTFAQPDLAARFGSTLVRAGNSRSFPLSPTFPCRLLVPRAIRCEIVTIDAAGVRQSTLTTAMFP